MLCLSHLWKGCTVHRGKSGAARRITWILQALLGCAALTGAYPPSVRAQEVVDSRLEYNVKAALIYAFARYVTWPNSAFEKPSSPFVIGVYGGNPFGDALQRIAEKKKVNERSIVIRQLKTVEQCLQCHIVFVTGDVQEKKEDEVFQQVEGKPVLLVGESPGFTERGGIINFYQSGSNVRFELNPETGVESQLSLNAKLLSLGAKSSAQR